MTGTSPFRRTPPPGPPSPARTPTPASRSSATVRVGRAPSPARDARVVGALPANVRLHLTVALRPRDPDALASYAQAVATPGSSVFHDYLTPSEFADRFGATPTEVR